MQASNLEANPPSLFLCLVRRTDSGQPAVGAHTDVTSRSIRVRVRIIEDGADKRAGLPKSACLTV